MKPEFILPFLIRFLPPLIVLALGFYAASDKTSRQRWTQLLYQAGSLRPEQRDDPKAQQGVRVPFFVLAALMLFLPAKLGPVSYYRWASRKIEIKADFSQNKAIAGRDAEPATEVATEPTPTSAPVVVNPPMPPQPGSPASPSGPASPASPGAPAPRAAPSANLGLQGLRKN